MARPLAFAAVAAGLLHRQAQGTGTSAHHVYARRQPGWQRQRGRAGSIGQGNQHHPAQRVEYRGHRAGGGRVNK